jgi:hypothetical protein
MTQTWTGAALVISLSCAPTISAQRDGSKSQAAATAASSGRSVEMIGCLQGSTGRDPAAGQTATATSRSGNAGAASGGQAAGSGSFVLTNARVARIGPGDPASATATAGSDPQSPAGNAGQGRAGSGSTGTSESSYLLEGPGSELTRYVGQQVEVTGTLAAAAPSASGTGMRSDRPGGKNQSPRILVASVRMIASTCAAR